MPLMDVTLGDLNYTLGVGQGNTFLRLAGNLCGVNNAAKLSTVFRRALTHARGKLFLSLQGCYTIDSQALAVLVHQHKELGERCRDMVLMDVPVQIQRILESAQISALWEIFPSLQDAEKKYGHAVC